MPWGKFPDQIWICHWKGRHLYIYHFNLDCQDWNDQCVFGRTEAACLSRLRVFSNEIGSQMVTDSCLVSLCGLIQIRVKQVAVNPELILQEIKFRDSWSVVSLLSHPVMDCIRRHQMSLTQIILLSGGGRYALRRHDLSVGYECLRSTINYRLTGNQCRLHQQSTLSTRKSPQDALSDLRDTEPPFPREVSDGCRSSNSAFIVLCYVIFF